MRSLARMLTLTTAMLALSACQSFPLTSWMFKRGEPRAAQMVPDSGSASLAEGRAALQAGRVAAAIGPLRMALMDQATRAAGRPTLPSTLALEAATNPFLRWNAPAVRDAARHHAPQPALGEDAVSVFAALRKWKNQF